MNENKTSPNLIETLRPFAEARFETAGLSNMRPDPVDPERWDTLLSMADYIDANKERWLSAAKASAAFFSSSESPAARRMNEALREIAALFQEPGQCGGSP